jgi:hypothetical protein
MIYPYSSTSQAIKTTRNIICFFVQNGRRAPKQNFVDKNRKVATLSTSKMAYNIA